MVGVLIPCRFLFSHLPRKRHQNFVVMATGYTVLELKIYVDITSWGNCSRWVVLQFCGTFASSIWRSINIRFWAWLVLLFPLLSLSRSLMRIGILLWRKTDDMEWLRSLVIFFPLYFSKRFVFIYFLSFPDKFWRVLR